MMSHAESTTPSTGSSMTDAPAAGTSSPSGSRGTLFDKVWALHEVGQLPDGRSQLLISLHLIHEVTSPQAFASLRERGTRPRESPRLGWLPLLGIAFAPFVFFIFGSRTSARPHPP